MKRKQLPGLVLNAAKTGSATVTTVEATPPSALRGGLDLPHRVGAQGRLLGASALNLFWDYRAHDIQGKVTDMWAQMITTRMKAGREDDLPTLVAQLRAAEQPGSGLVHSTATRDAKDPSRVIMFVVFESEERARERENDPRRQDMLQTARATMMGIFEGPPEFTDLTVVGDWSP